MINHRAFSYLPKYEVGSKFKLTSRRSDLILCISSMPTGVYPRKKKQEIPAQDFSELPVSEPEISTTTQNDESENVKSPVNSSQVEESFAHRTSSQEKVSFTVLDGKLEIPTLRAERQDRIKSAVRAAWLDEKFKKWAGLQSELTVPPIQIPPQIAGQLLDLIANIETFAFSKKTGLPYGEVHEIVKWSASEHVMLDAQTAAVVSRYVPMDWMKYADVTALCATLLMLITAKANAVAKYANNKLERIGRAGDNPKTEKAPPPEPVQVKMEAPTPKANGSIPDLG